MPLQSEATAKAVADAQMLAQQIVQQSKVQLGHLVSVSENPSSYSYNGPLAGAVHGIGMGNGLMDRIQVGNQQLAINSRRVEFSVSVFAAFAIE